MKYIAYSILLIASIALPAIAESDALVVHGIPRSTVADKMQNIRLPDAPIISETNEIQDIVSIIRWLERMTIMGDPDGVGVSFDLSFLDGRSIADSGIMKNWENAESVKPFPEIRNVSADEYLTLLTTALNLEFAITNDIVKIEKKKSSNHGLESTSAPPAAGTLETHP